MGTKIKFGSDLVRWLSWGLMMLIMWLSLWVAGGGATVSAAAVTDPGQQVKASRAASLAQNPFAHRYIIFLGGVNSSSAEGKPINHDFQKIETYLNQQLGIESSHFVYFSYSAVNTNPGDILLPCWAWGENNCSSERGTSHPTV